jgi:hypothetical protein
MTAFREGGSSRIFYVEHVCLNATGNTPGQEHLAGDKVSNPCYMVRMFFTGELSEMAGMHRARPEEFEYVTDMMPFPGKHSSGYTNCPLCGSMGRIKVDDDGMVPIYEEMTVPITE